MIWILVSRSRKVPCACLTGRYRLQVKKDPCQPQSAYQSWGQIRSHGGIEDCRWGPQIRYSSHNCSVRVDVLPSINIAEFSLFSIMKARKTMKNQALIQEVIAQISHRFTPKIPDIKKASGSIRSWRYTELTYSTGYRNTSRERVHRTSGWRAWHLCICGVIFFAVFYPHHFVRYTCYSFNNPRPVTSANDLNLLPDIQNLVFRSQLYKG